ncbi:Transcriptional regulatory protein rxt2 [Escovopsis weberi]|uniref:Transcriptional regulatory protein rxt2 n=1 Tax=Escovopsis weberi TaxID=150374 RepID=A0A0N0RSY4_ESCWE|nr:Transcriptional regulatory protein rxt2 [Escovopsis weberi]
MASQQILFAETIAAMKKAIKRKAYESDSDSDIESYTNRGHKLKRRARFAHKGQLMPTVEPSAYKEAVDYAGARRSIIHRNPPLIDEDGYEIDSDDDESQVEEAILSAAELNPYANIRLEHILAPLTASTDLPSHPVLSKPFTSTTLTKLVSQSCNIMHKENQSLWQVRHLWTSLCGDATWAPCHTMVGQNDIDFYSDDFLNRHLQRLQKVTMEDAGRAASPAVPGDEMQIDHASAHAEKPEIADVLMGNTDAPVSKRTPLPTDDARNGSKDADVNQEPKGKQIQSQSGEDTEMANGKASKQTNGRTSPNDKNGPRPNHEGGTSSSENVQMQLEPEPTDNPGLNQHKRPPDAWDGVFDESWIHPMFLPPPSARLDRNLGLPDKEAEDMRKLLALYVQKQEEVCRGAAKLHEGLLRAERLRKSVLHWAKAEAHCGASRDMSDGEDWYDKEEWGLAEDLKKGQDEEEEDTQTTGKKTRNRR